MQRIPIILDTDIGTDIDDSWALAMVLNSPELDLKMILTSTGDTLYRAKLAARMLETAGRTDIPIAVGIPTSVGEKSFEQWIGDYDLTRYPGRVYEDGIDACIRTITAAPETVTLVCIAPLTNVSAILKQSPEVAKKVRIVSMHGSIRMGLDGREGQIAEYNVVQDIKSAQDVFTADWPITITPLDTCGVVRLTGRRYEQICRSDNPLTRLVLEKYRIWDSKYAHHRSKHSSSILFDTVAVYLSFSRALLKMETLNIAVDEQGYMRITPDAKAIDCATAWRDIDAFKDLLVLRLV